MIRIDNNANARELPRMKQVKTSLVFTQLIALILNAAFGVLLYLRSLKLLPFDDHLLVFIRLWLFLILGVVLLTGVVMMRWHRYMRNNSDLQNHANSAVLQTNASQKRDEASPRARRRWRRFERTLLIFLLIFTLVEIIRFDVFSFFASFGPVHEFIQENVVICWILDRLTEAMFFVLAIYVLLKIPQTVGELIGSFDKLYVGPWRIHESVFGILWAIVGAGFVIFGLDGFDRAFGVLYILLGAIFIGRDYDDVRNLKFIQRVEK
jgi:hypothetical protein